MRLFNWGLGIGNWGLGIGDWATDLHQQVLFATPRLCDRKVFILFPNSFSPYCCQHGMFTFDQLLQY
ncbi:MAG: hypothetical protein HC903_21645 [Methylacidiphilales bacterium]|nr:hypothetical protein [Candidatus Methylacidiphilales bacterium]NJR16965.1 hypothetical protein [Calothrix sp. CSU_2_0]